MPPPYSIDTDIWIRIKNNYPPNIFKTFWVQLDAAIAAGTIRSSEEVLKDLEKGVDDFAPVLEAKAGIFVPLDEGLQAEVKVVMAACPDLADDENDRSVSDPFVVALAKHTNGTVVTGERPRKSPAGRRKIPDACAELNVPCLNWFDFLTEIGWDL